MGTYTPDAYQRLWRARAKKIMANASRSASQAASFMVANAKGMAPIKTGKLRRNIRKFKRGQGYEVISSVPGSSFPYNMWVEGRTPYRTLNYPETKKVNMNGRWVTIKAGTQLVYGSSPSHWNWTGTPRFFHFATLRTRKDFVRRAREGLRNALKVSF